MRNKGVSLSKKGQMDEAITWFDKALEVNPRDYDAMRQKKGCRFGKVRWMRRSRGMTRPWK